MEERKSIPSLSEVVPYVINNKGLIIIPIAFSLLLAFVVYLGTPEEFEVEVKFLPEVPTNSSSSILNQLGGAAILGGKNLGTSSSDFIDPGAYSEIVGSTPFLFNFVEGEMDHSTLGKIRLREFYRVYKKDNIFTTIKKYTIQLPSSFKESEEIDPIQAKEDYEEYGKLHAKDETIVNDLFKKFTVSYKPEIGTVVYSVRFYDPLAAKTFAEQGTKLLIDFLVKYKSQKATRNLSFVSTQFEEAQASFYDAQQQLANFRDSNMNVWSASAKVKEERLLAEFNRTNSVYNNLTQQLEIAKLKVQEDTPVFTVIEPPIVPRKATSPNGLLHFVGALFLGIILSFSIFYVKIFVLGNIQ